MKSVVFILIVLVMAGLPAHSQSIAFEGLSEVNPLKRGNTYQLNWSGGGSSDSKMKIEMVRQGEVIDTWETDNLGLTSITLSKKLKPSDDYVFKLSTPGSSEFVQTRTYKIRRKLPLGLQVLSVAAIPVAFLLFRPKKNEIGEPQLPDPPSGGA